MSLPLFFERNTIKMNIERLSPADIQAVMNIWLAGNLQAHAFIPRAYWEGNLHTVEKLLPQSEVYTAKGNGTVCGFIGLSDEYIEGLFVAEAFRGQGIGKALLDHAKAKHKMLTLCVYQKNTSAAAFYKREGFVLQGVSTDENTGETELQMRWQPEQENIV